MVNRQSLAVSLVLVLAAVAGVVAQTPATGTAPATPTTGTDVQKTLEEILEEPTTTDTYRYDPQGRRDPFRSLIGPSPKLEPGQRPQGVPGFLIDELKLQGIFRTRAGLTAMIAGPDNKGYTIKAGDKVLDGEVLRITPNTVVFRQEVNDPTRIERYREVVKDLSPTAAKR
ncbi:MAG TPA: pilus assembly protein PilP [Thermoanaerobaculia bacterium]|jgi:type IV pilus assembly protein PilP